MPEIGGTTDAPDITLGVFEPGKRRIETLSADLRRSGIALSACSLEKPIGKKISTTRILSVKINIKNTPFDFRGLPSDVPLSVPFPVRGNCRKTGLPAADNQRTFTPRVPNSGVALAGAPKAPALFCTALTDYPDHVGKEAIRRFRMIYKAYRSDLYWRLHPERKGDHQPLWPRRTCRSGGNRQVLAGSLATKFC